MLPGPKPIIVPSGILIHPAVWPQAENWGLCPPFWLGNWAPTNTVWPGPRPTFIPSGILIHPAVWPQQTWAENWGLSPRGGAGSPSNNAAWAEAYLRTKWYRYLGASSQQTWAENLGGGCAPFLGEGCWILSSTMSPGPRPTSIPSAILIRPAVWPE